MKRRVEDHLLSLHRLVQVVQRDTMETEEQRQWAERVVRAVHIVFPGNPKGDISSWPQCLRYLEQVQMCDRLIQEYHLLLPEAAELLNRAGTYLSEHASYSLAEPLYRQAVHIWEQALGPESPEVAQALNEFAALHLLQGKYGQAEPLYQRALRIWEEALGPDHPNVAHTLKGLADLSSKRGRDQEIDAR